MKFRKRIASALLALCMSASPTPVLLAGSTAAFAAEAAVSYTLSDIEVNGGGVIDFDPSVTEYDIYIPYVYQENDFTSFAAPAISAEAADSRATVEVSPKLSPETDTVADGDVIYIYVKDSEENIQNTYTLTVKTVGGNLFTDGGFETEAISAYDKRCNNGTFSTLEILDNEYGGAGDYVLHGVSGTDSNLYNSSLFYGTMASSARDTVMLANKTYINGFTAKLYPGQEEGANTSFAANVTAPNKNSDANLESKYWRKKYAGDFYTQDANAVKQNKPLTLTDEWGKYMAVVVSDEVDMRVGVDLGSHNKTVTDYLYDEMYLGELVIANAELADEDELTSNSISLPDEETAIPLTLTMANQYGNNIGLDKTTVSYELLTKPEEGVSFDTETNAVVISADAEPGEVVVEATVKPQYKGAAQPAVKTRYKLRLTPSSDEDYLPKAKEVTAEGSVAVDKTLTADYRFWSYNSTEDGSTYQWYYSEDKDSGYEPIPDATSKEYVVESDYVNYYICFEVTPKDAEGREGKPVKSAPMLQPLPPSVKSVSVTGEMEAGETLTGKYEFYDPNGDKEGVSDFRWIRIEDDGTETTLLTDTGNADSGSNYTVTEADMYKYLCFEVVPVSQEEPYTDDGEEPFRSKPYLCAPASVLYALSDIEVNGGGIQGFDSEVTEYDIYIPYVYKENDFESFPMPVVGATPVNEDAQIEVVYPDTAEGGAEIVIKVKDAEGQERHSYTLTIKTVGQNMFPDGGFETEDKSAYKNGDYGPLTWDIVADESGAGEKVLKANGGGENNGFYPVLMYNKSVDGTTGIYLSQNKTYVNGFMAKLDSDRPEDEEGNTFYATLRASKDETDEYKRYNFAGTYVMQNGTTVGDIIVLKDDVWGKYMTVLSGPENRDVRIGVGVGSNTREYMTYFLYDEMYLAELVISGITIADQDGEAEKSMSIPSGDTSVYLEAMVLNQYGNLAGLDESAAPVTWEMIQAPDTGVEFDKDNVRIDISPDAEPGVVIVEATATPKYSGAAQPYVKKRYKLTLEPNESSYTPKAKNVTAEGIVMTDEVLEADYDFYSYDSKEEGSTYQWYASADENGPFTAIPGATSKEYTVEAAHAEHYIYFEVTPKDAEGRVGAPQKSRVLQKPTAPTVKEITVSGDMIVGKTITASYEYFDPNGDSQGTSTFRWLRSESESGTYTAIDKATSKTYKITEDDIDCYLKFEVTPKSLTEPYVGTPVLSKAYLSAARPTASSVRIKSLGGGVYTASYVYKHPHNYGEGTTKFNWYLDDSLVGSENKLNLGSGSKGTLKLEVIPYSTVEPAEGIPAYDTLTLSSGGGGGNGGGPSGSKKPVTVVAPVTPVYEPNENPNANKHWASDAVDFVLEKGIMQNLSENDFGYDNIVTRAEFVEYIVRGLGKGETEYQNIFGDVTAEASYSGYLQTAVDMGMISHDVNFYPERPVSREEICKILLYAIGEETLSEEDVTAEFTALSDSAQISQWAVGFVRKAMKVGIMKGMGNNEFAPRGNTTRAQTAVLVKRVSEYITAEQEG